MTLAYDAADRRVQTKLPNGQTINYGYDEAGQLASIVYKNADNSELGNLTYTYDAGGRRIQVGGTLAKSDVSADGVNTVNAGNQLANHNGNAFTYDNNGNLVSDGSNTYTWNARNQLIQISGATSATFTYDALGRRQAKTVNGSTTGYVYDGANIVQELVGTANNSNPANIKASYLMGGIDEVFAQQTGTGSTARTLNYLTDALGSTIRLTDSTGAKVADYTYDPYGNTTADIVSGVTVNNPFQYTGRENDGNGLYYYRARYYSPALQRFISEDPIGLNGGINTHSYVGGRPINYVDPFGLSPSCTSKILGIRTVERKYTDSKETGSGYGVGVRRVGVGVGGRYPDRRGLPPIGPEAEVEIWLYKWTSFSYSKYLEIKKYQDLLMMCHDTISLPCGGTEDFYTKYEFAKLISEKTELLESGSWTERDWIRKLYTWSHGIPY